MHIMNARVNFIFISPSKNQSSQNFNVNASVTVLSPEDGSSGRLMPQNWPHSNIAVNVRVSMFERF